jgi:hypothetical protein
MRDADRSVQQHSHRFTFCLGVPVSCRDRRFFMERRDELHVVLPVVDDRFLQPLEARSGVGHHELDAD